MSLNRNEWYEILKDDSGTTLARWRDATVDQLETVYCFEKSLDGQIAFYEEYTDESLAIARLELAIAEGS